MDGGYTFLLPGLSNNGGDSDVSEKDIHPPVSFRRWLAMRIVDPLATLFRRAGLLLLGVLSIGLAGCYTQLQVADAPEKERRVEQKKEYADEYRRENRRDARRAKKQRTRTLDRYDYRIYDYRWAYGGWHYDPFFYDPWDYDPWYGSRFSVSFYFGGPYPRFSRSFYRYGGFVRPYYSTVYYGNQYYYFGDASGVDGGRSYGPRGATVGGGVTAGDRRTTGRRSNADRSVSRSPRTADRADALRTGRIGRSARADRTRSSARRGRSGRADRPRSSARIGRSSREADARRTRLRQPEARDRSSRPQAERGDRERSSRERGNRERGSRERSSDANRRESSRDRGDDRQRLRVDSRRAPDDGGRIGRSGRGLFRNALPDRIQVPDYAERRARLERRPSDRRSFTFERQRMNRSDLFSRPDRNARRARSRSPQRQRSQRTQPNRSQRARSSRSSASDQRARSSRQRSARDDGNSGSRRGSRDDDDR